MSNTYFIGDTHFGHTNVLKYDNRPYETIEEHDEDLIRRWNETVNDDDVVWFLGDLAFGYNRERTAVLISRLRGIKKMVMGNHDRRKAEFYRECGFKEVHEHPVILRRFFILSHEPMFITPDMPYMNIYAHVHNHPSFNSHVPTKGLCVSCCRWDYRPIRCEEWDSYIPEDHPSVTSF